jgi:hypothetical protein
MIGKPDMYYDAEERTSAHNELNDALDTCNKWEAEYVRQGVCPNCAGSGYQDGDCEVWDEDEQDYVEGFECDGFGMFGCDEGEMVGATWIEIINHDLRVKQRQISRSSFSKQKAIDEIAAYVKYMDDPRLAGQQVKIDYPHLGRHEISQLVTAGMRQAGLI